ncbi:MAG: Uma2 family endonuclease [Chloroflexi bacterium]|nr:Uma2 family endonuclease [Chloroflexota bacterium]
MAIQQRVYDLDSFWRFVCQPDNADRYFELIDGEIIEMAPPGGEHSTVAGEIYLHFRLFDPQRNLGVPTVEAGYYPPGKRDIVLAPDAAFTRAERAPEPFPRTWVPVMPDIAVEVQSPSNSLAELRRKAAIYLHHGTQLVWIILPERRSAEVCRLDANGKIQTEFIDSEGVLSGEPVLPGFRLEIARLFI